MNRPPLPAAMVLAAGLALGIAGDVLVRAAGPPGLNLFIWVAALGGTVVVLHRRSGGAISGEARMWLGVGLLFAAAVAWRDSPALKLLALAAIAVAFALPALRAGVAWVRQSGLMGYVAGVAAAAVRCGLGTILVLSDVDWGSLRGDEVVSSTWRRAAAIARGIAIAIPLLVVFGGLFIAADAVFAQIVAERVRLDFGTLASHVLVAGFVGWIATGYLHGFLTGTRLPELKALVPHRPSLGIVEVGIVLGLLDLLFLLFVLVQFRYLFGGAELVEVTPGLTYAEYARRGFFELVSVSVLMLPLLLAADWLLQRRSERDEWIFRGVTGMQIVLMAAVMVSALQRMQLYQVAYGLTEQRFYATALLVCMGVLFLWFAATALRGRRHAFALGALMLSFAAIAGLQMANPDAIIAHTNTARALRGETFDIAYASSLSGDATPVLLATFADLPEEARCPIARRLLSRWSPTSPRDWRSWSWSDMRARAAVRPATPQLEEAAMLGGNCP